MRLPEVSVRNPVMTVMVFLGVILLGAVALTRLKVDLLPEVEPPQVSVITLWPGAGASDVESEVTEPIENQLTRVSNLDRLTSRSLENLSVVNCRFKWGTDLVDATNEIRDALELTKRDLPDDVEEPMIFRFSTAVMPVLFLFVTASESYPQLYHIADKVIADELKRVPGVGAIVLYGGLRRRIRVQFDPRRLEAYGLDLLEVGRVLAAQNLDLPAGQLKVGRRAYTLRVPGRFKTVEEIGSTVIGAHGGRPVYLRDVAEVSDAFAEPMMSAYGDGRPAVVMAVQRQTGANTVEVVRRIKAKLEEIRSDLPPDVRMGIVFDGSEFVLWSLETLRETLYIGLMLVVLVTFLFLRRFWAGTIILLAIPFSLIGSFILMMLFDYTINSVTLSALAIAAGMVVDDAIVVLENITRHLERGARPVPAAIYGSSEVGLAVAAATLTIVAVFVPLIFVGGLTGIFFKQLAFVITVSILASLFNSLTLTPMLASKFLRPPEGMAPTGVLSRIDRGLEGAFRAVEGAYGRVLGWAVGHRGWVVGLSALLFSSSLALLPRVGTELAPPMDSGEVSIGFRLAEGTRLEETDRVLQRINDILSRVPEAKHSYAFCGQTEKGIWTALGFEEGANVGEVGLKLVRKHERTRSATEVAQALREEMEKIPGLTRLSVSAAPGISQVLMGGRRRISIEVWGQDLEEITRFARKLKKVVEGVPGAVDVTLSQKPPRPELWVEVDREKASLVGVNVAMVAQALRAYFFGADATEFREAGEEYDVRLRLRDEDRRRIEAVLQVPIPTLLGGQVRLGEIATLREGYGPVEIERRNRQRIVRVEADTFGRPLGEVVRDVERALARMEVPRGVKVRFAGEVEEQKETFRDLRMLFGLGVVMVYMVMASLFKSYRHPFVIMFSVPFAVTGVILALLVTGTTLSMYSFLGLIMLTGIVTKNAIVLIDYTNILRERGLGVTAAVVQAGRHRLRPVLMTTATTFLGMLPLALSRGEGSEMWNGLGVAMLGGLTLSSLVTLVLVPVVYHLVEARRR